MHQVLQQYKAIKHNSVRRVYLDNFSHNTIILVNLYIATILNKNHHCDIYFVDEPNNTACKVYRQLNYIPIPEAHFNSFFFKLKYLIHYYADKYTFKFYNKKLHQIKIKGLFIGDLLVDTVLRFDTKGKFDRALVANAHYGFIKNAYYHYHKAKCIFKDWKINEGIISHPDYINFGIMPRLGVSYGLNFVVFLKGGLFKIVTLSDIYYSKYHLTPAIWKHLNALSNAFINSYLERRFAAQEKLFDADYAYSCDKTQMTKQQLVQLLDINPELPICTIYLHAFADANHYEQEMIYNSYFDWFMATLDIITNIKHVNWLIKDHPHAYLYNERGFVQDLLKDYSIKYVPSNINAKSVLQISDSIVTVRGTVGLEAICYNIKPILCGYSYYSTYGFTINCKTEAQYINALKNITFKTLLSDSDKLLAGRILYYTSDLIAVRSSIIDYALHPFNEEDVKKYFMQYCQKIYEAGGIANDIFYDNLIAFLSPDKVMLTGLGAL
jgi:hypothetical protein